MVKKGLGSRITWLRDAHFGLLYKGNAPERGGKSKIQSYRTQGAVNCQVGNGSCQEMQEHIGVVRMWIGICSRPGSVAGSGNGLRRGGEGMSGPASASDWDGFEGQEMACQDNGGRWCKETAQGARDEAMMPV